MVERDPSVRVASEARERLEAFVAARSVQNEIETYEELTAVIHGDTGISSALIEYVIANGTRGAAHVHFGPVTYMKGRGDGYRISASFEADSKNRGYEGVTLTSYQRGLPFFRFRPSKLVSLHPFTSSRDQALVYHRQLEDYTPYHSSPRFIDDIRRMGNQALKVAYETGTSLAPPMDFLQTGLLHAEDGKEIYNRFLTITTELIDQLLRAET